MKCVRSNDPVLSFRQATRRRPWTRLGEPGEPGETRMENIVIRIIEWAACGLFVASMATDIRRREVPNAVPVLLIVLFAAHAVSGGMESLGSLRFHLLTGAVMLAVGFGLYCTRKFGAADGKLMAVAGIWMGPVDIRPYLFGMAASALALSAFALLPIERARRLRSSLPFALAIAPPAVIVIVTRTFQHGL